MKFDAKTRVVSLLTALYICLFAGMLGVGISEIRSKPLAERVFIVLFVLSFIGISRLYCLRLRCEETRAVQPRWRKVLRLFVGVVMCLGSGSIISVFWVYHSGISLLSFVGMAMVLLLGVLDVALTILLWSPLRLSAKPAKKEDELIRDILN